MIIDCAGCGYRHESLRSRFKKDPRTGKDAWFCSKWFATGLSQAEKMKSYAPGEIASGVHMGMDYQRCYGSVNHQEDFSVERGKQMKELSKALSET